jgi:hypothetical protein
MIKDKLTKRIMRRVYAVWIVRRILPQLAIMSTVLFVGIRVTADRFFVAKIVENFTAIANSNIFALPRFMASALNSAEPAALVVLSISGVASFFLAIRLLRSIRTLVNNRSYLFSKALVR